MRTRQLRWIGFIGTIALMALPLVVSVPSILRVGSIFFLTLTILAGLHLVTGLTRFISLNHAALVGVGAYGSALASARFGVPTLLALCVGAALAALVALLLAWVTRRLEDHYFALATLASGEVLSNVFRSSTSITGGANGFGGIPPVSILGLALDTPAKYYPLCVIVGLVSIVIVQQLDRATPGRALRAMGDEGALVEGLGVSSVRLRAFAFTIGGALAGLAGAVSAHVDGFVGPETFSVGLSIIYLCFLVIGGLGRIHGVVLGAALLSIGPELFRGLYAWQMVIVATASLTLLVVRSKRLRKGSRISFGGLVGAPGMRGAHE